MARSSAERHFLRFQQRGRPEDLAVVFDSTAAELLRVASHLGRDLHEAEDLVQNTFLAAIQHREQFQRRGDLLSWLLGILVNKSRELRRQNSRRPAGDRLARERQLDPSEAATAGEMSKAASDSIAGLPEPYRTVISLHLRHNLTAQEIALSLHRPPGTVRTQLARGMEMLRKALPTGFGLGAVTALSSTRGLCSVRKVVLDHAGRVAAMGGAAVATVGGVFLMKKMVFAVSFAALACFVWWQATGTPTGAPPIEHGETISPSLTGRIEAPEESDPDRVPLQASTGALPSGSGTVQELLRGIVVNEDGDPVPGAVVDLQRRVGQDFISIPDHELLQPESLDQARTGADGTFSFPVAPLSSFALEIEAAGYGTELVLHCSGGQYRRVVLDRGAVVEGFVSYLEDHRPLEGALVRVYAEVRGSSGSRPLIAGTTRTDARGFYRVERLSPREQTLLVVPPRGVEQSHTIAPVVGEVLRLDFALESGGRVDGVVRDALTGQPVGGAMVSRSFYFDTFVSTDERGRFQLVGASRVINVRATGYVRKRVMLNGEASLQPVDVTLTRGGAVKGRVLDAMGDPLAGVYVAAVAGTLVHQEKQEWWPARSDADGRFRIANLGPGLVHHLFLRHPGYGSLAYVFPEEARSERVIDFGDVILHPASGIRGRIVDQSGNGLSASVSLQGTNEDRLRYLGQDSATPRQRVPVELSRSTVADEDGGFQFGGLSPGVYELHGWTDDNLAFGASFTIDDWGQVIGDVVVPVEVGMTVAGHVRTPTGEPPGRVTVLLHPDRGDRASQIKILENGNTSFEFRHVKQGRYTLEAQVASSEDDNRWFYGRRNDIEAGMTDVRMELGDADWIEGIVQDARGDPVAGITVFGVGALHASGLGEKRVRTDSDGRFRLKVGEGDVVDVHAGPPVENGTPELIHDPDPASEVVLPRVRAGTRDLIIRLR